MDYTTLARVKLTQDNKTLSADSTLALLLTQASRAIDRKLTGVGDTSSTNYLMQETKTESLFGRLTAAGSVVVYPRKPIITAVQSIQYRLNSRFNWVTVDSTSLADVLLDGIRVEVYPHDSNTPFPNEVRVLIGYTGGFATSGSDLDDDIQDAASLLTIRAYREYQSGVTDAIGVAELGQMVYTKAWPVRVLELLNPYVRRVGWRGAM